jgi:hypothetical protein
MSNKCLVCGGTMVHVNGRDWIRSECGDEGVDGRLQKSLLRFPIF